MDKPERAEQGAAPPAANVDPLLDQAIAFHRAGLLTDAERLYRGILAHAPANFDALHLLGVIHHQRAEYADALRHFDMALKIDQAQADAHNNRGNTLKKLGRPEEAVASYDRAIALDPEEPASFNNRGTALRELRQPEQAVASYDRAIALKPDFVEALNNRGNALHALGHLADALADYDRAVALKPDQAEVFYNRGNALRDAKRLSEALASYDKAILLKPDRADYLSNRGIVLFELGRFDEALNDHDRAIALNAEAADFWYNRAGALQALRRFEQALANYDQAIRLRADYADAFNNRGIVLAELNRLEEALASYDDAVALAPDRAEYLSNRAVLYVRFRRFEAALQDYDRLLALGTDAARAYDLHVAAPRLHAKMQLSRWDDFASESARLLSAVTEARCMPQPFLLLPIASTSDQQRRCAELYVAANCPPSPAPLWRGERYAHDRIRVAYLSADFDDHPVPQLAVGVFEKHDRARFESYAISFGPASNSDMRQRLMRAFDRFVDMRGQSDDELAGFLRHAEIDVAVDLMGFTEAARTSVFSKRPVPIQVNFLGYPGTMGASYMDYLLADRFLIPPDQQASYSEKVVYLPDCYQANDDRRRIAETALTRGDAGLPTGGFVFCCFNNNYKITPEVFDVWMRLLRAVDGSVLWLLDANSGAQTNLRREAERRGVPSERLIFAPRVDPPDHIARHRLADLFIDTYPYNAHTTASEALWAGLPIVTCSGGTFASRVAGSLLTTLGVPELVTHSLADYEAGALRLARDPVQRETIRSRIIRNRLTHPLFDTERFTRHLEAAYVCMWQRHQRGEPPQSFTVAPI